MYKHLFFDLDHTIWDFEKNASESLLDLHSLLTLDKFGIDNKSIFLEKYLLHNTHWWNQYHIGAVTAAELKWKRMYSTLQEFGIDNIDLAYKMSDEFLDILPEKKGVFDYTFEILDYLQAKDYKLHLITNGFEITQHRKLNASGLHKYFNEVITSEASGYIKPQPQIFTHALTAAGATITNSLMLGDNIDADIKGAHGAGWHTVFVNHIGANVPTEATYSIGHLRELKQIL